MLIIIDIAMLIITVLKIRVPIQMHWNYSHRVANNRSIYRQTTLFVPTYRITGFVCGLLFIVKFCGQVSTAKKSIAKNKFNTALKLFTCRAPLLGTCRIWILTLCWVIQVHVPCCPLLYAKSCTLSYKISKK